MWSHTRVTIFPAGHPRDIAAAIVDARFFPEGSIEDFHGAVIWTEPGVQDAYPDALVINTMRERRVYEKPRLLSITGAAVLLSVLSTDGASGTMRSVKVFHILLREYHPQ